MNICDYIYDALDAVLAWEIPEDAFPQAVMSQACLLAGLDPDEVTSY